MAEARGVRTIAFPAISTGVYGYPVEEAAAIALREVKAHLEKDGTKLQQATFVLFGKVAYEAYARLI
jgi:O-acetyl-ADP-ribose deacetylase (regulator of RNase III)